MSAWVLLSIMAAAFQTLRFMLQKQLSMGALSATGATFARFVYAVPFALVVSGAWMASQAARASPRRAKPSWAVGRGPGAPPVPAQTR